MAVGTYLNPYNPADKGLTGQRNWEDPRAQGRWTATNWNLQTGKPIGNVQVDAKGHYILNWVNDGHPDQLGAAGGAAGGGGVGSPIPGAGTYGMAQTLAQQAYDNAVAAAKAKKSASFRGAGILENTGQVDPNAQYGTYQQMLQGEGAQLDADQMAAMERGLGGKGLANQAERLDRYSQAVQNLQFQTDLQGYNNDYNASVQQAELDRRNAMYNALLSAMGNAYGDWGGGGGDGSGDNTDVGGSGPSVQSLAKAYAPVKVKGQWHGAWGPVSKAAKNIIKTVPRVSPASRKPQYKVVSSTYRYQK